VGEVVFKNYRRAWNLVTITTPALWNTAVFTVLFTLLSIAINTFAGYALSRYALGPAQMFLVGFLALAAFPVEAIAVPNFLLLREIGILNTVWALVLPTTLNGYYIYLMKSVFDSIPRNFIEEADMEGPGEWQMFRVVMLPFARPMLAVVALYAFLFAYSNFLWALIVCQQRSQWIMPVFMFAANSWFLPPQLLGALMVMSILPPLVIFVFAHRTLQHSLTLPR
jgi:ABC-type glycerol-3-phosphate transport system permease component